MSADFATQPGQQLMAIVKGFEDHEQILLFLYNVKIGHSEETDPLHPTITPCYLRISAHTILTLVLNIKCNVNTEYKGKIIIEIIV